MSGLRPQRRSEGDIADYLSGGRGGRVGTGRGTISIKSNPKHKPLVQTKSAPTNNVARCVHETIGTIKESEREVEWAAREVEYLIRRERRAIEQFEKKSESNSKTGKKTTAKLVSGTFNVLGWISLKRETEKNHQAVLEDVKRANAAVKAAEDKLLEMGVTLEEEERQLEARALELRRKSVGVFKFVSDNNKAMITKAENERVTENGELRICEITSL